MLEKDNEMKDYILPTAFMVLCIVFYALTYYHAHNEGMNKAFDSIIMEECWLNKESRDIECIEHIKD